MSEIKAGKVSDLKEMIRVKPYRILSKQLLLPEIPGLAIAAPELVLYAMDKQETISSETSPRSKLICVLEGKLQLQAVNETLDLTAGASVLVPPDTRHGFAAGSECKFLIISL